MTMSPELEQGDDEIQDIFCTLHKPSDQVILEHDYTFTTPYCGSELWL